MGKIFTVSFVDYKKNYERKRGKKEYERKRRKPNPNHRKRESKERKGRTKEGGKA